MARIDLKNVTVKFKDGLSGTGAVNDMAISAGDTTLGVDTLALNTTLTQKIPIGARFTIAGETGTPKHTVTARVNSSNVTTSITFTPALAAGVADNAVITFAPQELEIKIGEGNLTYSEKKNMEYQLDRGNLDTVREGDQVPMEINLDLVYEQVTTGTSAIVTPVDALKHIGGAAEWVSSSADPCEPFAIDIEVLSSPPCGETGEETSLFPDFRYESLDFDLSAATISAQGKCNATGATVTRA